MVTKTESIESEFPKRIIRPFKVFLKTEQLSGLILIFCTLFALIVTNFLLFEDYNSFWATEMTIKFGDIGLSKKVALWINDGLMA
ncbi:MAG: Na+/H+ antiporter NhaA, partial [Candidatus Hodarchaeota archaeon]